MSHTSDELEAAFADYTRIQAAQDWDAYCELFTDDAVYIEHEMGTFHGREAIREWLVPIMEPLVGWEYPVQWHVVDPASSRVVFYWLNIMPNVDSRPVPYEVAGMTVLTYAGDGRWARQEDLYNMKEVEVVLGEWFAAGGSLGSAGPSEQ